MLELYKKLSEDYPAIQVISSNRALGHGNRIVYWAGSDGTRCVVLNYNGDLFTIANTDLVFVEVVNAAAYSFEGGRLRFQKSAGSVWIDAGPLKKEAATDADPSINKIKKWVGKKITFEDLMGNTAEHDTWESDSW